jgi:hypothetical protein
MTVTPSHPSSKSTTPKPKRRWLQFNLRTLLVLTLVVGLGLGWMASQRRKAAFIYIEWGALNYDRPKRSFLLTPMSMPLHQQKKIRKDLGPPWISDYHFSVEKSEFYRLVTFLNGVNETGFYDNDRLYYITIRDEMNHRMRWVKCDISIEKIESLEHLLEFIYKLKSIQ